MTKRTKEIADRENEFKGKCNIDFAELSSFLDVIRRTTGIALPNIVKIFRDKVWDFELYYEEKDKLFFDNNYLRAIVMSYLEQIVTKCYGDYIVISQAIIKYGIRRFEKKSLYRVAMEDLMNNIDQIKNIEASDLPTMLEIEVNNTSLYSSLLPDTVFQFFNKCLIEIKELGFDMEKDLHFKDFIIQSAELKYLSECMFIMQGFEKSVENFDKFKKLMDIDIESPLVSFYEDQKSQCHL